MPPGIHIRIPEFPKLPEASYRDFSGTPTKIHHQISFGIPTGFPTGTSLGITCSRDTTPERFLCFLSGYVLEFLPRYPKGFFPGFSIGISFGMPS